MKSSLIIALCFLFSSVAFSQRSGNEANTNGQGPNQEERQKQWEEMRLKRIAYFTDKIGLTSEEAQLFWPIVNDIQDRSFALNREMMRLIRIPRQERENKETDYEKINTRMAEIRQQQSDLDKERYIKLKAILSPEKLYKYYLAEEGFSRELLRSFDSGRQSNRNRE
ncbi:MAG: hypothetical protein PHE04_04895 [Bacteroidales bacterium]|nr:hypothetical protein [Bacteroidales bacterium]MDD3431023.1 hypothetical protein [Bacteroidales bacterium]MDD4361399.1 hypothetical protein [Bacteroidales bacterium]MDD4431365.1 hypothetical protein [Bacteroidales bacterium]